jgi:uncharacterized MnhB-related membrane protein
MTEALLISLLAMALLALLLRNLFGSVIVLAVFSLVTALLFYYLDAPDLAVAEAAVGGGLATALFVWTIARTATRRE